MDWFSMQTFLKTMSSFLFLFKYKKVLTGFFIISVFFKINSQPQPDSTLLPFKISQSKKLPFDELTSKKEGWYAVGIPGFNSDPINGFGVGADGSLFYNGKKTDPFFAYSAYRSRLNAGVFITSKFQKQIYLNLDVPYIFNSKWRLKAGMGYLDNPNGLYFGIDENSLKPLSYHVDNNPANPLINHASYDDYNKSLTGDKAFYNTYTERGAYINVSMERAYFDGRVRLLAGYVAYYFSYSTPLNNNALLHIDADKNKIKGFGNNFVSLPLAGIVYDTRDLETDPTKGIFAELMYNIALTTLGSRYNFNKTFFHFNVYRPLLPRVFKKLTFAARIGMGYTQGNAPFFEYQSYIGSENLVTGLGGGNTLRGYKQSRFLSNVMTFSNIELRCRFAQLSGLKQHLAFSIVPFFDVGMVSDNLNRLNHLENLRYDEGLGLRIAWNVNTILRFDYAFSQEDNQFFFTLGHTF